MKFRLTFPVLSAHGSQTFTVEANDKDDAITRHNAGDSEFEAEEVEVQHLGKPDVDPITDETPAPVSSDIVNGIGVYLTDLGRVPVLVTADHEVVFLTPCHTYGWTRDGKANSPQTRADHGDIRAKLYDLAEPKVQP
jgi:hypothetical protein